MKKTKIKRTLIDYSASAILALSSVFIMLYLNKDLGEISGLNEITIEQTSSIAASWLPRMFGVVALTCFHTRAHWLQLCAFSAALSLLAYLGVDQYEQLVEFEKMGIFEESIADIIILNSNAEVLKVSMIFAVVSAVILLFQKLISSQAVRQE